MSLKGQIKTSCPSGCDAFEAEMWTFIRGDKDRDLKLAVQYGECNLLLCPGCGAAFFPEESYVYLDAELEILAFVFPASQKDKADFWRNKMNEDSRLLRQTLGEACPVDWEPELFFGPQGLSELLEKDELEGTEREVMEHLGREMGLSFYPVSRRYARSRGIPASLPYEGGAAARESVMAGLRRVLAENNRLKSYRGYLDRLEGSLAELLPPRRKEPREKK